MIYELDPELLLFPSPYEAEDDGLLAVGGDLRPERLMLAYRMGIFPWYSDDTPILWHSPAERFVLFPNELRVTKSMHQVLRSGKFRVTEDQAFERVIRACAGTVRKDQDGTWITNDMQEAYIELHRAGAAHSVEVWFDGELAGGLYGIEVGDIFCGESMFSSMSNASKVALIHLCREHDYRLIDCQVETTHLESMGARLIPRSDYLAYLV